MDFPAGRLESLGCLPTKIKNERSENGTWSQYSLSYPQEKHLHSTLKGPGSYSQAEHGLHGDEKGWYIEGLKENFSCSFAVFPRV